MDNSKHNDHGLPRPAVEQPKPGPFLPLNNLHSLPTPPPHLHTQLPPLSSLSRTSHNTPVSSPGLFSPGLARHGLPQSSVSESNTPIPSSMDPYLHPLQGHTVRETHKALIDSNNRTGRKLINQYEVIEEIGRGMHGKVKLARNIESGDNVAIKIIPRFSKKRRLGKVTALDPQDKTKKEIAILKKVRHPNVVALLEVIDDPQMEKIYMVLEHVELGEVVWRKKGLPHICSAERKRIEREIKGEVPSVEEDAYAQLLERRHIVKQLKRAHLAQRNARSHDNYWSVEHGATEESSSSLGRHSRIQSREDFAVESPSQSPRQSRASSLSRSVCSAASLEARADSGEEDHWDEDIETPGPLRSGSAAALEGTSFGSRNPDEPFRIRSPSMADSIISHMSSLDFNPQMTHDPFVDDFSYVPCFTFDQARTTFRDTVLGLEYLHWHGIIHRDIKPANLLWTRDHRVKISDFGVSYFGRPIREGEPGENISEAEARDFDDDLELAKTVGTPAFFAPELCYTDLDQEQPKVSELIDIWSLGVTLYCLIYARIPFLAEDEFQMFRKIATEEVHIPRRRLKPVDPSTSPTAFSLYKRHNRDPYRDDNDLHYEEVDNLLLDLLRQMLTKNPDKRIRLRDIKRHPWVVQGLPNPVGWLDDTDPLNYGSSKNKIQVNEKEISSAVVPITFLERARSAMKKAVGKVIHPLVDRSDASKSRRRAASSVNSSGGDSMINNGPPTPQSKLDRRKSMLSDDYFGGAGLSMASSSESRPVASQDDPLMYDPMATVLPPIGKQDGRLEVSTSWDSTNRQQSPMSGYNGFALTPTKSAPYYDGHDDDGWREDIDVLRKARDLDAFNNDTSRARSNDRSLFASTDKRAQAQVSLSNALAPGSVHGPFHRRGGRSVDMGPGRGRSLASAHPSPSPPLMVSSTSYQHRQPQSDPNLQSSQKQIDLEKRPCTAHRIGSTPGTSLLALETPLSEQRRTRTGSNVIDPADIPCPLSPDEERWPQHFSAPLRGETMTTTKSSSLESIEGVGTPLTCPSEGASPPALDSAVKDESENITVFRSDPSLPALLSGASSVSADTEAELLGRPGIVSSRPSLLETTDSLTPPALGQEPSEGFPLGQVLSHQATGEGTLSFGAKRAHHSESSMYKQQMDAEDDDHDQDEDSDDGLLIMARSKKSNSLDVPSRSRKPPFENKRRDTGMSTASIETARRVDVEHDEAYAASIS